jgi:hypothetical protein
LNLELCSKQYNKNDLLHLIVAPQLNGGWQHNYSTKTRQTGLAYGQSLYWQWPNIGPCLKHSTRDFRGGETLAPFLIKIFA